MDVLSCQTLKAMDPGKSVIYGTEDFRRVMVCMV